MTRLIDADALKKHLHKDPLYPLVEKYGMDGVIDAQPTIDAEPVRHGNWRFVNCATGLRCQCSECLHWVDAGTDRNYCPNCGARMDEE